MAKVAVINSSEDTVVDRRAVIVTTTNEPALERFVGPTDAVEIFTEPYDVEILIDKITHTMKAA